jgi:hypothetical protein
MKNDPTIKTDVEVEDVTVVVSSTDDEWDNIIGDLVIW